MGKHLGTCDLCGKVAWCLDQPSGMRLPSGMPMKVPELCDGHGHGLEVNYVAGWLDRTPVQWYAVSLVERAGWGVRN